MGESEAEYYGRNIRTRHPDFSDNTHDIMRVRVVTPIGTWISSEPRRTRLLAAATIVGVLVTTITQNFLPVVMIPGATAAAILALAYSSYRLLVVGETAVHLFAASLFSSRVGRCLATVPISRAVKPAGPLGRTGSLQFFHLELGSEMVMLDDMAFLRYIGGLERSSPKLKAAMERDDVLAEVMRHSLRRVRRANGRRWLKKGP